MMDETSKFGYLVIAQIILGGGLLVVATSLAAGKRGPSHGFGWIVVAGLSCSVLALAAALHSRTGDGIRAAFMQTLAVMLAAALAAVSSSRGEDAGRGGSALTATGRVVAWLTLVGLPPTIGFHSRVMVYRALLEAEWRTLTALAMAASLAALIPAMRGMRAPSVGAARGGRAVVIVALTALILLMGVYPQSGLSVATWLDGIAGSAAGGVAPGPALW